MVLISGETSRPALINPEKRTNYSHFDETVECSEVEDVCDMLELVVYQPGRPKFVSRQSKGLLQNLGALSRGYFERRFARCNRYRSFNNQQQNLIFFGSALICANLHSQY